MGEKINRSVYISSTSLMVGPFQDEDILIYPSSNTWNDFHHRTLFEFRLAHRSSVARVFRLGFLGTTDQPEVVIKNTLKGRAFAEATDFPQFFSLQFDMDAYREVVQEFGIQQAESILLLLNDLVAVRKNRPVPKWVDDAVKTEVFAMSLVRTSESFFAFFNAKSILSGLMFEDLKSVSDHLKFSFKLAGFNNAHSFDFKFNGHKLVPGRIAILVGKNGVGKSRTLNQLVSAALEGRPTFTDGKGQRPQISRIIAISTPGETESTFPPEPEEGAILHYRRISALPYEKTDTTGQTLPEILLQLSRRGGSIGKKERWRIFTEAIQNVISSQALYLVPAPVAIGGVTLVTLRNINDVVPLDDLRFGGEQRSLEAARRVDRSGRLMTLVGKEYAPLSSGQISFVRIAAQLCLHIDNGTLLLVDEPETHLHPNLVTDLIAMLNDILELSGSIAIIATHSAYLLREVPNTQVHVIRETADKRIDIVHPRLKTFGADVGAISDFVFGDSIVNRLIDKIETDLKEQPERFKDWENDLKSQLPSEAIMELKQRLKNKGASE